MTFGIRDDTFRRAVYISFFAHIALFIFILISPSLPRPSRKGMIHYVPIDLLGPGGGGGGGRGAAAAGKPAPPQAKKETLRDLTTPQKAKPEAKPEMSYPVEKPKKTDKKTTEKKAAISQAEPPPAGAAESAPSSEGVAGTGMGTGLRIGTGGPGGGWGPGGPGYGGGTGLANFPYTYYLTIITDRVSANWFSSLVDPGVSGTFQTIIFFKIQRDGQITEVQVEQSSGLTPLDLSAMRAVKASAPFPPLPRDYEDAYLGIHLIFEHAK
jgi:TonB family protein